MKVIYEFNCELENDDRYDLKVFQRASQMYIALNDIQDYLREWRKGWNEDNAEQMEDKISTIICDSNIGEIE